MEMEGLQRRRRRRLLSRPGRQTQHLMLARRSIETYNRLTEVLFLVKYLLRESNLKQHFLNFADVCEVYL